MCLMFDEKERLNNYIEKLKNGIKLSEDELEDFVKLSRKLREYNPNEQLWIFLNGLAEFLYSLSKIKLNLYDLVFNLMFSTQKNSK